MQFKHVLGPESLKTSKVGGPEPSSSYGIAGDPTGPGSQNFFVAPSATSIPVNALAEPHICQYTPTLLWARLVPPLSAPASCGCFPLSCTGRSVTSPRPFTCVPGRAVAPLRCTHRRKLVLSPKRTLPEEGHTVFLSSLCSLPFYFFVSSGRAAPPVVCVGVSPGPLGRPLAGPLCRAVASTTRIRWLFSRGAYL